MKPGPAGHTILLIDLEPHSCERRAQALRDRGVLVDCAQDAAGARARFAAGTPYDLILLDLGRDAAAAQRMVGAIRSGNPQQKIGLLLGTPPYIAMAPGARTPRTPAVQTPDAARTNAPSDFGARILQAEKAEKI